jgi:hypothetical protein
MGAHDVIIIGMGAGGGTLARASRLGASASYYSSAATGSRASRLFAPALAVGVNTGFTAPDAWEDARVYDIEFVLVGPAVLIQPRWRAPAHAAGLTLGER